LLSQDFSRRRWRVPASFWYACLALRQPLTPLPRAASARGTHGFKRSQKRATYAHLCILRPPGTHHAGHFVVDVFPSWSRSAGAQTYCGIHLPTPSQRIAGEPPAGARRHRIGRRPKTQCRRLRG
jgi:hypothetical protein